MIRQHVERFAALTPREGQVMREVARGRLNKQIAYDLEITEITVKLHRSNCHEEDASNIGRRTHPCLGEIARAIARNRRGLDYGMVTKACNLGDKGGVDPEGRLKKGCVACPGYLLLRSWTTMKPFAKPCVIC